MSDKKFEDMYDVDKPVLSEEDDPDYNEFDEKDYNEIYAEEVKIANIEYASFKQDTSTSFDGIINKYKVLVGLIGESYEPITKIMFYSLLANQLKGNKFSMESKQIDLRLPVLLQLKAGHGKKNYEYFIKRTIEGLGKQYQEPTSYHPEQFVGKIIVHEQKGEDPDYIPVFGTLAADFLVIDEAHAMLTRKENEECLRYIRTALDPIGDNTIMKKQVNIPDEHKLKFDPTCTMLLLTQPITNINEDLLMRGSFRRFIILFSDAPTNERRKARQASKFLTLKEDIHNKIWIKWIEFNKILSEYKNLQYVCHHDFIIDDYLDVLEILAQETGKDVFEYYNTSQFTIKQNIFKMSIIRAIVESKNTQVITISANHIKSAIKDWDMIWKPQVAWISRQLQIESLNPLGWTDKHQKIMNIIDELNSNEITTEQIIKKYFIPSEYTGNTKEDSDKKRKVCITKISRLVDDLCSWQYLRKIPSGKKSVMYIAKMKNDMRE